MKETAILIICLGVFTGGLILVYCESIQPPTEKSGSNNNNPGNAPKIFYDRPVGLIGKELKFFENRFEKPWKKFPGNKESFPNWKNTSLNKLSRHILRQPKKEVVSKNTIKT